MPAHDLDKLRITLGNFKGLDIKKLEGALNHAQEKQWYDLHTEIMTRFYGRQFTDLLDKRNSIRIPIRMNVFYSYQKQKFEDYTHDISVHGLCLPINKRLQPGFLIKIKIPTGFRRFFGFIEEVVKVDGMVSWMKPASGLMGVEFLTVPKEEQRTLLKVVHNFLDKRFLEIAES